MVHGTQASEAARANGANDRAECASEPQAAPRSPQDRQCRRLSCKHSRKQPINVKFWANSHQAPARLLSPMQRFRGAALPRGCALDGAVLALACESGGNRGSRGEKPIKEDGINRKIVSGGGVYHRREKYGLETGLWPRGKQDLGNNKQRQQKI